ncbi:MAG: carboxypeptidase regulatory-like domain-containing protein [bacterium]|nr:carboxypeptidase regulatory-like domain-containing protein [bacterium]
MVKKHTSGRPGHPIKQPLQAWVYGVGIIVLIGTCTVLLLLFKPRGMDKQVTFLVHTTILLIPPLALFGFMRSVGRKKTERGKTDGKGNRKRLMTEWGGPVVLFVVLWAAAPQWEPETGTFSFAIFLRDADRQQVFKNKMENNGTVSILLDDDVKTKSIDPNGRAYFEGIPVSFMDKTVSVELTAPDWTFLKGNTTVCRLKGKSATLTIKRKMSLGSFSGRVTDGDGAVVPGAAVSIRDISVETDESGWFHLIIPPGKQAEIQTLVVRKQGFRTRTLQVHPGKDRTGFKVQLVKE